MARSRNTKRILFQSDIGYHSFYWVSRGDDGSIYFGSSVSSKHAKFCYKKSLPIPREGKIVGANGFKKMGKEELSGKYSIHQSGTINTPSERNRHKIDDLDNYGNEIPLICIAPMKPDRYPQFSKTIKEDDVILDGRSFETQPFALLVFISKVEEANFKTLESSNWNKTMKYVSKFESLFLCVYMYSKSEGFEIWPEHELEFIATNDEVEGKLAFPILQKLPEESYWRNFR